MIGAYQITVATHSARPPEGGRKWAAGDCLGQVIGWAVAEAISILSIKSADQFGSGHITAMRRSCADLAERREADRKV